jgi:ankyrin repeat protein
MHVGLQSGNSALQLAEAYGKSEAAKVLCEHGARGALCYAAKNDLRDMLAELISKGHDLEERDQVLVYEALSCAQVLVYEALSDLEERDQVLVYEALSCAQVLVYEAYIYYVYI